MYINPFSKLIALLLIISSARIVSQPYTFQSFALAEGLPQSQAGCIYTDSRGFLWTGTEGGGLSRYDGDHFEIFTTKHQLSSNFIRAIVQTDNYTLYVGTSKGLDHFDGKDFHQIPGLTQAVTTITPYEDSLLMIGTADGLYILHPGQDSIIPFYADSMDAVLSILTQNDDLWIGTKTGLWQLSSSRGKPKLVQTFNGQGIYSICHAGPNQLWLSSWGKGIVQYNTKLQRTEKLIDDPLIHLTNVIHEAIQGQLWIGTQNNGLVFMDTSDAEFIQLTERDGLPHYNVKAIVKDKKEHMWVATSGGGIARCTKQNFRAYTRSEGLSNNRVYALYAAQDETLWLAAGNTGIQTLDSNGIKTIRLDSVLDDVKCKTITGDEYGRIWIGTVGAGLIMIDSGKVTSFTTKDGLPDLYIQKIVPDKKGHIWIATYTGGLASIRQDTSGEFAIIPHELPYPKLSSMIIDQNDRLWIGTNNGRLFVIENDTLIWESSKSSELPALPIRALAFDAHGRLCAGTGGGGVYFGSADMNDKPFLTLPEGHQLSSKNIYLLLADEEGQLWAGTESGVDRIVFKSTGEIKEIIFYGRHQGFFGIETCHDAAAIGSNGKLWFGTMNGLMAYSPGEETRAQIPPRIHFDNIALFYKSLSETSYAGYMGKDGSLHPGLTLHHSENHISFSFRGIDLDNPEAMVYRWQLNGIDTTWSPSSKQSSVSFASLQPGSYTLQVQASTDENLWSDPIVASFSINAPYWQQRSFQILMAFFLAFLLFLLFYIWSGIIKKREAAKREKLTLTNHLLQLEQKALQLQMNPHFIFNALTSIKSLMSTAHLSKAKEEINAFAQLMRGILNNSRKTSITLTEEAAVLDRYLHIEQLCHPDKFEYQIQLPQNTDPDELEIPPMLIQPFVENAVVHGIASISGKGQIDVKFQVHEDILICTIQDNGLGRDKAKRLREERKPGHQPVAMKVTQERLETMRGKASYESLKIEDVILPNGTISGTLVTVRIPVKLNW